MMMRTVTGKAKATVGDEGDYADEKDDGVKDNGDDMGVIFAACMGEQMARESQWESILEAT